MTDWNSRTAPPEWSSCGSSSKHSIRASAAEGTHSSSDGSLGKKFPEKIQLAAAPGFYEPATGLKLGRQAYFENFSILSTGRASSPTAPSPSVATKRTRTVYQNVHASRCQVEGCNLDLKTAKDYHRKHRICERHSKSPKVIVAGLVRRFCQQCSRFHDLSEFDDKKRSCRKRLSDHNARRRRPQPERMHIHLSGLASSLYDARQQRNLVSGSVLVPINSSMWQSASSLKFTVPEASSVWPTKASDMKKLLDVPTDEMSNAISLQYPNARRLPFSESSVSQMHKQDIQQQINPVSDRIPVPFPNTTWQSSSDQRVILPMDSMITPTKIGAVDKHLGTVAEGMPNATCILPFDMGQVLSLEDSMPQMLNPGLVTSANDNNSDRGALSLLSTNLWGLSEHESSTLDQLVQLNQQEGSQNWASSLDTQNRSGDLLQELPFFNCFYCCNNQLA